ncbi:MAG: tRNA (N(6)-L-threonylcarbamoyladenosine(37)-C(2))-methylthiotransferase MtaB [Trichloromonadaceae bacterium]
MSQTVALATLGCKTNQFESAALEQMLRAAGYTPVPFEQGADLVVVNTCTVTAATDSQSRNLVRRARRLRPDCRVVVTGCYAQVDPAALQAIPGVSLVLGNEEKQDFLRLLQAGHAEGTALVSENRQALTTSALPVAAFAERSRAFVQIQTGCDAFCAYCIIPYARGRSRSVAADAVLAQVAQLVETGYPEIVLTGIHIGQYGADLAPQLTLLQLLRWIVAETGVQRLRLGSLEPTEMSTDLLDWVAQSEIICPHFHIPLQAGDDAVLKRMNRHYTAAQFTELVEQIHRRLPQAAIGLDVIAGFPGETETEFANTLALIEGLPISHLHVFPFSRRPGTPAATMSGQIAAEVIKARAATLRVLGEVKQQAFARRFVGQILEVVVEGQGKGGDSRGLSRNYLPVRFTAAMAAEGRCSLVRITGFGGTDLEGVAV